MFLLIVFPVCCTIAGLLPKAMIIIKELAQKMFIQISKQFFEEQIHIEQRYHLQQ